MAPSSRCRSRCSGNTTVHEPIGEVLAATVTPAGIHIRARFAQVPEPGRLRDRLEEAWQSVKAGLVRGLSIGFLPIGAPTLRPGGGRHIKRWQWGELSAVTMPMNIAATITSIKSAATGGPYHRPGDTGARVAPMNQTYSEQIAAHAAQRQATVASMAALMTQAEDAGATLDDAQTKQYDGWANQVKSLDGHLARLREFETLNVTQATPIAAAADRRSCKCNRGSRRARRLCAPRARCSSATATNSRRRSTPSGAGTTRRRKWRCSSKPRSPPGLRPMRPGRAAGARRRSSSDFLALLRPATILGKIRRPAERPVQQQGAGADGGRHLRVGR